MPPLERLHEEISVVPKLCLGMRPAKLRFASLWRASRPCAAARRVRVAGRWSVHTRMPPLEPRHTEANLARKKHKAAKPPANRPITGGQSRRQEGAFSPFPPPACNQPVWRHLWTLLAAGFALRLLAAFSADWAYRADEIMQYLEQAHRLVFGAGFMPWEIRLGARNLLIAAPAAGVMALCKSVGGGAGCYVPAIELFYTIFSLAIPASLYFIARRMHGETAGRAALVLGSLWYEFVVFAPHLMPEQTASIFILVGLACVPPREALSTDSPASAKPGARLLLAGFLIGLGGMLRLPYVPVAGALGILILARVPLRFAPHVLGGAVGALAVAGAADWAVWGTFLHSYFSYLEMAALTSGFADAFGEFEGTEWYAPMRKLAACSAGLWPLLFVLAAAEWRRYWPALAMLAILLFVHAVTLTIAYSHVFLALPLFALIFGGVAARPPEFLRGFLRGGGKKAAAAALALLSLAGAAHALPGLSASFWPEVRQPRFFFHNFAWLQAARFLSQVPPEKMRAVVWNAQDPLWTGGYYYFHHPVPQWHEGMKPHRPALEARPLAEMASHYVALSPDGAQKALAAGFTEVANFGAAIVYENPEWAGVPAQWENPFPLELGMTEDEAFDRALKEAGKPVPPPVFLTPPR